MTAVLDASIVIRFLNQEKGWEKILPILEGKVCMSSLNVTEFYTWCIRQEKGMSVGQEMIGEMDIQIIDFDSELAELATQIYLKTKPFGLSLGDRACLCTAKKMKSKVYTCDKIWSKVSQDFEVVVL